MSALTSIVYVLLFVWIVKKLVDLRARATIQAPYPPGPRPKPLIGNVFDFPLVYPALRYAEWGKVYSSHILHLEALGNHVVVLNKREDADELFEKRAKIYSDRPTIPIIKLLGWDYNIALLRYGDEWRRYRRVCQQNFNHKASQTYHPLQIKEVRRFLQALHDAPEHFDIHSKRFSISLTMSMMYGYEVQSIEDPCVTVADEAVRLGSALILPGGSLINIFPILQHIPAWFPGAASQKTAKVVKRLTNQMMTIPMNFVRKSLKEGTAIPSLVTDFYEKKHIHGASQEEEDMTKNIAYSVYGGASDTTISATGTFLYTMAVNPNVQRKAQAEIDLVIGSKRLPTFEDRRSLPYIEAIYREVMRFWPPLPLGAPHTTSENDYYKGYFIPKGTTAFANVWAMTHDEEVYPDPFSFKPERFFDDNGVLIDDDRILAYGFGRRVCVGKYVASSTMWLIIASVIACFNITKSKDEHGKDIEIDDGFEDCGAINQKSKFECSFRVRSPEILQLIIEANN